MKAGGSAKTAHQCKFSGVFTTKIINFLQQKNIKTILEQLAFYKKSHKNQTHYQLWQEGCHPEITKALIFKPSFCKNFRLLKIILTVAGLVKIGIQCNTVKVTKCGAVLSVILYLDLPIGVFYHSFALNLCIPKQELGNEI
jgi:hypothetical protein